MKDTSKTSLHRGHNEGNIRQRTDGRWEVRLSAGIDYKTGKPKRTSTCCNTRQEAIAILQQQAQDKIRAGDKYTDYGFIVTNEFGHYFEQKTFKDYYDRLLKDADIGHFTFHALRHTFATRALERGMDYKTLSAILGHYSVAFTMDTYVHSMDEHKRREMDKMDDMFGMQYSISVENQPYPVLCTLSPDGCTTHVPDFPKIEVETPTLDATLLEVKQQIQKALRQYKKPPIPTKQEQIVVPNNSVLVLVKAN
ncbi:MAG: tyrosine-type recombinase/integrase [Gemmiger sp.]